MHNQKMIKINKIFYIFYSVNSLKKHTNYNVGFLRYENLKKEK